MKKLTDLKNGPAADRKKPLIIINLKRKKKQSTNTGKQDLENRFDDLLSICRSISQDRPNKKDEVENLLFCDEELGNYSRENRQKGIRSSRSYRLDLPEIREIQQENQEERKSFCKTDRPTGQSKYKRQLSTGLPKNQQSQQKPTNRKISEQKDKSRPLCSSFSVSSTLMNYGLMQKSFAQKFRKISIKKRPISPNKAMKIDVTKLLQNQKQSRINERKTQSSLGYYSRTCY